VVNLVKYNKHSKRRYQYPDLQDFGPPGYVIICPDPDPHFIKQKIKKNLDFSIFVAG
jgi:hypothetical protein